jgi:MFS transporter, SP family, galactose:H+ symporter
MVEAFTDPNIRRAAWAAVALSSLQQFCGINDIMFYSSVIFENFFSPNAATLLIQTINLSAVVAAIPAINRFGRKPLLVITYSVCALSLLATAYCTYIEHTSLELFFILVFIAAFEFGPGPITWAYMSEVCNDKGTSAATSVN